jgi:hypothetical protein
MREFEPARDLYVEMGLLDKVNELAPLIGSARERLKGPT